MKRTSRFRLTRAEISVIGVVLVILAFILVPVLPNLSEWRRAMVTDVDRNLVEEEFRNFELGREFETARKEGVLTHGLDVSRKPLVTLLYQRRQHRWFGLQSRVIEVTLKRTERGTKRELRVLQDRS